MVCRGGLRVLDFGERVILNRDPMVPPRGQVYVGWGDYKQWGYEMLGHMTRLGGLRPEDRVLDLGSGTGRMALPLTHFLGSGAYDGVEIRLEGVEWCQRQIATRRANFRFHHADIFNRSYNPSGKILASEYRLPFGEGEFDFVFMVSVFTHMLPMDVRHYMGEVSRVLRPGGRVFVTWFLLNEESMRLMPLRRSFLEAVDLGHPLKGHEGVCRVVNPEVPEAVTGYDEGFVRDLYEQDGFGDIGVHFGAWCGRYPYLSYQDIVVAQKVR